MSTTYKRINLLSSFLFLPTLILAKDESSPMWDWVFDNILIIISLCVVFGVIVSLFNMMNTVLESTKNDYLKTHGRALSKNENHKGSLISKLYQKAWSLAPMDKEADIDLGHDYDGIRELDNSLPPWWIYGFYLTIIIAFGYMYVYHFSDLGNSQMEEYELAMDLGKKQRIEFEANQVISIDEENLVAYTDAEELKVGKMAFTTNCVTCHGADGQGSVGPNLTDDYWIHGGSIGNIYKTIKHGVPEKGMISWRSQMKPATILKLASFIKTLKGTNPPNPKEKQGDLYTEELIENETSPNTTE